MHLPVAPKKEGERPKTRLYPLNEPYKRPLALYWQICIASWWKYVLHLMVFPGLILGLALTPVRSTVSANNFVDSHSALNTKSLTFEHCSKTLLYRLYQD